MSLGERRGIMIRHYGYWGREGDIGIYLNRCSRRVVFFLLVYSYLGPWATDGERGMKGLNMQGGRQRKYIYIGSMNGFGPLSCYFQVSHLKDIIVRYRKDGTNGTISNQLKINRRYAQVRRQNKTPLLFPFQILIFFCNHCSWKCGLGEKQASDWFFSAC